MPRPVATACSKEVGDGEKRAFLLVPVIVIIWLALVPVGKVRSSIPHAATPPLGGAESRLVLVEPEPQGIRPIGEICRDVAILLRRADAGGRAPMLLAEIYAAEERGGVVGGHEKAARAPLQPVCRLAPWDPGVWAGGGGAREEEEEGGGEHAYIDQDGGSWDVVLAVEHLLTLQEVVHRFRRWFRCRPYIRLTLQVLVHHTVPGRGWISLRIALFFPQEAV